jgi:hypothetical protein
MSQEHPIPNPQDTTQPEVVYTNPIQSEPETIYAKVYNVEEPSNNFGFGNQQTPPNVDPVYDVYKQTPDLESLDQSSPPPFPPAKPKFNFKQFLKDKWWLALLVVCLLVAVVFGLIAFFMGQKKEQTYGDVGLRIEGETTIPLGATREFVVTVENKNPVKLYDVNINLITDSNFKFAKDLSNYNFNSTAKSYFISEIAASSTIRIPFEASLTGNIGSTSLLSTTIEYKPKALDSKNEKKYRLESGVLTINIDNAEIKLELQGPEKNIEKGSQVQFITTLENISDKVLENLVVVGTYPLTDSFTYKSSSLATPGGNPQTEPASGNNTWNIPSLPAKTSRVLTVTGVVPVTAGSDLNFDFEVFTVTKSGDRQSLRKVGTKLATMDQPLAITVTEKTTGEAKIIKNGSTLNYEINYSNKSTKTISNNEIRFSFVDPVGMLDLATLSFADGNIGNLQDKTIVWRGAGAKDLVDLAPGAEKKLNFSVKLKKFEDFYKDTLPQNSYTVKSAAEISTTGRESVSAEGGELKLEGGIVIEPSVELFSNVSQTSFASDAATDPNFRVARVTWNVRTNQNQVKDTVIESGTPISGSIFKVVNQSDITAAGATLNFNSANGGITLNSPKIENYLGLTKKPLKVVFEIKVKPGVGNVYKDILVLRAGTVSGVDDVTGVAYSQKLSEVKWTQN